MRGLRQTKYLFLGRVRKELLRLRGLLYLGAHTDYRAEE